MKIRIPDYYNEFVCIADRCPDTCCQGWAIVVDEQSYADYQNLPGEIGQRLRSALRRQDGEYTITCQPDGRCKMLDDDGLCSLQKACGPQALCQVCDRFPRFQTEIGQNREVGLSLACPEAARLILTGAQPVTFHWESTPEPVTICHEVDAEFYFGLRQARDRILELLQDRTRPLQQRVQQAGELCDRLQRTQGRFARHSLAQVLETAFLTPCIPPSDTGVRQRHQLLQSLAERQPRRADWIVRLQQALSSHADAVQRESFNKFCQQQELLQEQLLVYYFNKYLIRAAFDRDISGAGRYCLASWAIIRELALHDWLQGTQPDWILLAQQYAAETENDEACRVMLYHRLRKLPRRKMQELLSF